MCGTEAGRIIETWNTPLLGAKKIFKKKLLQCFILWAGIYLYFWNNKFMLFINTSMASRKEMPMNIPREPPIPPTNAPRSRRIYSRRTCLASRWYEICMIDDLGFSRIVPASTISSVRYCTIWNARTPQETHHLLGNSYFAILTCFLLLEQSPPPLSFVRSNTRTDR